MCSYNKQFIFTKKKKSNPYRILIKTNMESVPQQLKHNTSMYRLPNKALNSCTQGWPSRVPVHC